jgi:hypothetical protein
VTDTRTPPALDSLPALMQGVIDALETSSAIHVSTHAALNDLAHRLAEIERRLDASARRLPKS